MGGIYETIFEGSATQTNKTYTLSKSLMIIVILLYMQN